MPLYNMYAHVAQKINGVSGNSGTEKPRGILRSLMRSTNKDNPVKRKNSQKTGAVHLRSGSKPPRPQSSSLTWCMPSAPSPSLMMSFPSAVPTSQIMTRLMTMLRTREEMGDPPPRLQRDRGEKML